MTRSSTRPITRKRRSGIYAQDQWTKGRATFNAGLRFDYYNGYIPEVREPAHDFTAALEYPAVHGAPAWKDINPRVGFAYDLFGNGRTAAKVSLAGRGTGNGRCALHPLNRSIFRRVDGPATISTRPEEFSERRVRLAANPNFGRSNPNATEYAQDVRWMGIRPYT
jgi:hypothetical protein